MTLEDVKSMGRYKPGLGGLGQGQRMGHPLNMGSYKQGIQTTKEENVEEEGMGREPPGSIARGRQTARSQGRCSLEGR